MKESESQNILSKRKKTSTEVELLEQRQNERTRIPELRKQNKKASTEVELLEQRQNERKRITKVRKQKMHIQ